jgi:ABC-2 type transport system ATP-binding protein
VIEESHTDKQSTLLVRTDGPILDQVWSVTPVTLEDLVLAYMSHASGPQPVSRTALGLVS